MVVCENQRAFRGGERHFSEIDFAADVIEIAADERERFAEIFRHFYHFVPVLRFFRGLIGFLPAVELTAIKRRPIHVQFRITDILSAPGHNVEVLGFPIVDVDLLFGGQVF